MAQNKPHQYKTKLCEYCKNSFMPTGSRNIYCSPVCMFGGPSTCEGCRQVFVPKDWGSGRRGRKTIKGRRFCSRACFKQKGIPHQARPVGGGYYVVYVGRDYPGARPDGRILVHRKVMQEHIGRPLLREETIHHINGDTGDNRIENLEIWVGTGKQTKGIKLSAIHCPTCSCGG
jgi:hypothetical protein